MSEQVRDKFDLDEIKNREDFLNNLPYINSTIYNNHLTNIKDPDVAADLTQETVWGIYRGFDRFKPLKGPFRSWVFRIAQNKRFDFHRKQARKPTERLEETTGPRVDFTDDINESIDSQREAEKVRAGLKSLPPIQRQAIEMTYYDGLTQLEAAQQINVPLGTFKSRIRLAMARLRSELSLEDFSYSS